MFLIWFQQFRLSLFRRIYYYNFNIVSAIIKGFRPASILMIEWSDDRYSKVQIILQEVIDMIDSFIEETSEDIKRHEEISEDIRRYKKMSEDIKRYEKILENIRRYKKMSGDMRR